jgi:hypothetical protein
MGGNIRLAWLALGKPDDLPYRDDTGEYRISRRDDGWWWMNSVQEFGPYPTFEAVSSDMVGHICMIHATVHV